jgi:hypothetical protein
MTPSRIEPATFQLLAQNLNHLNLLPKGSFNRSSVGIVKKVCGIKTISEYLNIHEECSRKDSKY